ncbi:Phenolphthiocerol synthesis polyketide synthase type I Pks15/1 [Streptomyces cyanogenus]|uniref:Phenolphthiocerol synthesis polyketide synthase type I Pks15/1 n=1 Tax=Streptomyces cyanogenus TaxID=80860 RepID=A0ABX7TXT8_STRCY|nr:Phenolphthiocerol synthesis polyketide synthase type I Pks15/1 [Streptomyces cyanogenus]
MSPRHPAWPPDARSSSPLYPFVQALRAPAEGRSRPSLHTGTATPGRPAFLFTGQGSRRAGMGRELHEFFPAFTRAPDAGCEHLDPLMDGSVRAVLFAVPESAEAGLLDRTEWTRPALPAFEVALFRLLES